MSILKVSTDVDNLMQSADNAAIRTSIELGSANTVEFGAFIPPAGTTAEIDLITTATVGQVMVDTDRGQVIRFTGAASYDVITSRSYEPTLKTTQGAALTLPATRLFESGVLAGSPDVFNPTDILLVYPSKNPSALGVPISYLYHTGEQGSAGWYNAGDPNAGPITSAVFTPDTLMQLRLGGIKTAFLFSDYVINTATPINLTSAALKLGSTYSFDLKVSFLDLLGSNAAITVDYDALLDSSGFLSFINTDTKSRTTLFDTLISSPAETTRVVLNTGAFSGVEGSNLGIWKISGTITPSSSGTLTINLGQNSANVNPLFYSEPAMTITLLSD